MSDLVSTLIKGLKDDRRGCDNSARCNQPQTRSMDKLMESEWEELVIQFDKKAGEYVFKTACCPGAPAC